MITKTNLLEKAILLNICGCITGAIAGLVFILFGLIFMNGISIINFGRLSPPMTDELKTIESIVFCFIIIGDIFSNVILISHEM
jgi:hypothetical protein